MTETNKNKEPFAACAHGVALTHECPICDGDTGLSDDLKSAYETARAVIQRARGGGFSTALQMRVLVACEFSGVVRDAFRERGHEAWSCDLEGVEPEGKWPNYHLFGDARDFLSEGWDMLIAHPPCTYLCRSGWHWVNKPDQDFLPLKGEPRRRAAKEAAAFFLQLLNAPVVRVCVENPRPICHVNLPLFTQSIQPWMFGHGEVKETCLWLRGLKPLEATNVVDGRKPVVHFASPGKNRGKDRSRTHSGIAQAMAAQWG